MLSFTMLNRGSVSVLIHPLARNEVEDHTRLAWPHFWSTVLHIQQHTIFSKKKSMDHFFYLTCSDLSKLGLIFFNSYSQNQNPIQKLFDNIKLQSKNLYCMYCTPKVRSCYKTFNVVGNTFCLRRHQSQCNWGGWSAILGIEAWILSTCIN